MKHSDILNVLDNLAGTSPSQKVDSKVWDVESLAGSRTMLGDARTQHPGTLGAMFKPITERDWLKPICSMNSTYRRWHCSIYSARYGFDLSEATSGWSKNCRTAQHCSCAKGEGGASGLPLTRVDWYR